MNVKKEPGSNASSEVNKVQNNVNIVSSEVVGKEFAKFIRQIQLGEVRLYAQIDSGASVCTVRASVVFNENLPVTRIKSTLGGFGNSQVIFPGIVTQIVILDNLNPREVDFRVVPDTAQEYDVMLGRPFTEALDISYKRIGHELNFILEEDKVLEPGKINFVKVCSELGSLELTVSNFENKNLTLKKGQKIGNDMYSIEEAPKRQTRDKPILNLEVYTDKQVTLLKRQQLMNLVEEHIDCIASVITELGYTDKIEMEILLKDGPTPFQAKPYRLNAKDRSDLIR